MHNIFQSNYYPYSTTHICTIYKLHFWQLNSYHNAPLYAIRMLIIKGHTTPACTIHHELPCSQIRVYKIIQLYKFDSKLLNIDPSRALSYSVLTVGGTDTTHVNEKEEKRAEQEKERSIATHSIHL